MVKGRKAWSASVHGIPNTMSKSLRNNGQRFTESFLFEGDLPFLCQRSLMQYKPVGLCTFRVNRMRDFHSTLYTYPAFWCILQKANVSVTWWHLSFSLHIKSSIWRNLYPVWYLLCISLGNFQCFTFVLFKSTRKKKRIPLLLMCIALSTATEWSQSNCL